MTTVSPAARPLVDHRVRSRPMRSTLTGPQLDGVVVLDHEDVLALLAGLHGRRRHDDAVGLLAQDHA